MKMFLKLNKLSYLIIITIVVPIYFNLGDFSIFMTKKCGTVLPISLLFVGVFGTIYYIKDFLSSNQDLSCFNNLDLLILLIFCYSLILTLVGFFRYGIINFNMFFIYNIPMIVAYKTGTVLSKYVTIEKFFNISLATIFFVSILHIISSMMEFGFIKSFNLSGVPQHKNILNLFGIYQIYNYFPFIVSIMCVYTIWKILLNKFSIYKFFILLVLLVEIIMLAAREPLFVICLGILFLFFFNKEKINKKKLKYFIIFCCFILLFGAFLVARIDTSKVSFFIRLNLFVSDSITARRSDQLLDTFQHLAAEKFFVGNLFSLIEDKALVSPHNQYIEWLYRGGIFYMLLNILVFYYTFKYIKFLRRDDNIGIILQLIFSLIILVSFNARTAMRVPYSSIFIWALIGMISSNYNKFIYEKKEKNIN